MTRNIMDGWRHNQQEQKHVLEFFGSQYLPSYVIFIADGYSKRENRLSLHRQIVF